MKTKRIDFLKLTQAQVAGAFGITPSAVARWRCPRNSDKSYALPEVIKWRVELASQDEGMSAETSPAVERYRMAKAKLAELELAERQQVLLPRAIVHEWMGKLGSLLRNAGEILDRDFGRDAHQILEEALDDFGRMVEAAFNPRGDLTNGTK